MPPDPPRRDRLQRSITTILLLRNFCQLLEKLWTTLRVKSTGARRGAHCEFLDGGVPLSLWSPTLYQTMSSCTLQPYSRLDTKNRILWQTRQLLHAPDNFSDEWYFTQSRWQLTDFYTLFQTKLAENHTPHNGICSYNSHMRLIPPTPASPIPQECTLYEWEHL